MDEPTANGWLDRFHAGDRAVLDAAYRESFARVSAATGSLLSVADRETIVHEVFLRLVEDHEFRRTFLGGDLTAWLGRVARNRAIDYARRHGREVTLPDASEEAADSAMPDPADAPEARSLVARFRKERLPGAWERVFEIRFLRQLGQREAARELGMHRSTLIYQEHRIRALLRRFLLHEVRS